ncbi:permease-like cell division protein FtsX [Clostridium sp. ZS2-4]|uniref:permease-like cell division protein FtsX n=1 Tax=Clostridium sp. ZS2-4 TaxID=2987703 RepID=UPI00227A65F8|nr:permease-like cell division protein FtsX [Clostridium sp. ZS2-4]MCY6354556.1 permease-like cell division protein FtsX [Clostridium sp. ZS2-4]
MKISTLRYFSIDALKSLKRNKTLSIASIITVSLTLFMFGIFIITMLNVNKIVKNIGSKLEVQVFLKEGASQNDKSGIEEAIKNIDGIVTVTFQTKEEALQKYKELLGEENKNLLIGFDKKNLPESYIVKVKSSDIVENVVNKVKNKTGVEEVRANRELVDIIDSFTKGVKWLGSVALVILIPISLLLIGNTIKLAVYSRKKEIGIMKFVGATDSFIRWPFIIEGIIIGLIGSFVSCIFLNYGYKFVYQKISGAMTMLNLVSPVYVLGSVLWIFVLSGIIIGGIGSIISIRKFLRV